MQIALSAEAPGREGLIGLGFDCLFYLHLVVSVTFLIEERFPWNDEGCLPATVVEVSSVKIVENPAWYPLHCTFHWKPGPSGPGEMSSLIYIGCGAYLHPDFELEGGNRLVCGGAPTFYIAIARSCEGFHLCLS